ncbi:hypothetical protein ABWH91_12590 [Phycisphaerales bacterium ac7]
MFKRYADHDQNITCFYDDISIQTRFDLDSRGTFSMSSSVDPGNTESLEEFWKRIACVMLVSSTSSSQAVDEAFDLLADDLTWELRKQTLTHAARIGVAEEVEEFEPEFVDDEEFRFYGT